jgi:hypothetical protein
LDVLKAIRADERTRHLSVLTEPARKKFDEFYGNLGLEAVEQFSAFTLDFGAMHFYVH